MQTKIRMCPALTIVLLLAAGSVQAHDFWIEPGAYHPAVNEVVHVGLRVGHWNEAEDVRRDNGRIRRFDMTGPRGQIAVVGQDGVSPAGVIRPTSPGLYIIAYENSPVMHEMLPESFRHYLREEGLDEPLRRTGRELERMTPYREAYSRCAKSLIAVGGEWNGELPGPIGLDLELVPLQNPCQARGGAALHFQVLFRGQPISGVLVRAVQRDAATSEQTARSDGEGLVSFIMDRPATWLIHAVHMTDTPADSEVDWRSYWASFTFDNSQSRGADPGAQSMGQASSAGGR